MSMKVKTLGVECPPHRRVRRAGGKTENWKLKIRGLVFLLLAACFLLPVSTQAVQILPHCDPIPRGPGDPPTGLPPCGVDTLLQLVVNIYNWLLGLAALVAMLFIIFGGVRMLYYSYLEDSSSELESAKFTVRRAIGGFVIIALSYLLVGTTLAMLGVSPDTQLGKILVDLGLLKK